MMFGSSVFASTGFNVAILVPVITAVYWIMWVVYARTLHPLSHIPGPFLASISRVWIIKATLQGDVEKTQRSLHRKYGKLVRIAPNEVACADPSAIKKIYPATRPLTKTDFYPVWDNKKFSKYPDSFSVTDEQLHTERRRIVNHVYSLSNVVQSEKYIDRCSELFMTKLDERADGVQVIDLGEWLHWYAFDSIGELFFGRMFGFMKNACDHNKYIHALDTLFPTFVAVALAPTYVRPFIFISAIFNSTARKALKAIDHIAAAARTCVDDRRAENVGEKKSSGRQDLLHQLLEIVQEKGEKVDFGVMEAKNEAYVALFAGSDTTAVALRACLYYLMKNPKVHAQVLSEIDTAVAKGQLSFPVKYSDAIKLSLFCASVKEAMRMHPSVGLTMPRIAPVGGLEVDGTYIPAGYRIGMNAAVTGYDEDIYGADAEEFRPSRWLEGDAANMEKHSLVFGAGTRTCLGKNISLAELHKLLPQVIWRYDMQLAHPERPWRTRNLWFVKQFGIDVKLKIRPQAA